MMLRNTKGMTLVEVLVATLVFTMALGALLSSILTILYFIDISKAQTIAITDLRNVMERIRATPFANTVSSFPDNIADGPLGNPYQTIVGGYTLNNEHIRATYANTHSDPLEIKVTLTWQDKRGRPYNTAISTFKTR